MCAAVLKAIQIVAEALHEDRTPAEFRGEPVAVLGHIQGKPQECPNMPEPCLFLLKSVLVA